MSAPRTITVRGVEVPRLGFGTWQITGETCVEAVAHALELGYRHVDTAKDYGNEQEVGRAIAAAGISRAELFVTTKVWHEDLAPDRLRASAERSLERLGLDHVDLLLIHQPSAVHPLEASLETMLELQREGRTRLIGVSNFGPDLLRRALELAPVGCDQVEMHPYLMDHPLLDLARDRDVFIAAYSPLAKGLINDEPVLAEIAAEVEASPAQVTLAWLLGFDRVAVLPKAATPARREENLRAFDIELTDAHRARIAALTQGPPST